jgi:ATP-dependent protease ClpP protease subunit
MPQKFIYALTSHKPWFDFSRQQRKIGDLLLSSLLESDILIRAKDSDNYDDFITVFSNAHYHWGISIENGFKGLILKYQPSTVKYDISNGDIVVKNIGPNASKTHDLLRLAEVVGIFKTETGIFKNEEESKPLKEVLRHLTDMIRWGARYPLPMNSGRIHKFSGEIPSPLVYGFHILDVMNPLFDFFDNEDEFMMQSDATINIEFKTRVDQNSIGKLLCAIDQAISEGHKSLNIILDTQGGEFLPAVSFYDEIQKRLEVAKFSVYNGGNVKSCGIILYLAFDSHRFTLTDSIFMIHAVKKKGINGLDATAVHMNHVMADILSKRSKFNLPLFEQVVQNDIDNDIDSKTALNFGIVYRIIPSLPLAPETVVI